MALPADDVATVGSSALVVALGWAVGYLFTRTGDAGGIFDTRSLVSCAAAVGLQVALRAGKRTDTPAASGDEEKREIKSDTSALEARILELEAALASERAAREAAESIKERMEIFAGFRDRYLKHVEHTLNNPVQGIILSIEAMAGLVQDWTSDLEEQGALRDANASESENEGLSTSRSQSRSSFDGALALSENGKSTSSDTLAVWESRMAEFGSMTELALSAVDNLHVTVSDMYDGLACGSADAPFKPVVQPTNVYWTLERCQYALRYHSAAGLPDPDGVLAQTQVPVAFSLQPHMATIMTDSRWLFSTALKLVGNAKRFTREGSVEVSVSVVTKRAAAAAARSSSDGMLSEGSDSEDERPEQNDDGDDEEEVKDRARPPRRRPRGDLDVNNSSATATATGRTEPERCLRVEVRDTGRGVPEELRPLLFTVQGSDPRYHGFGLYMVAAKVKALGGTYGYRPNEGGTGSVFWMEIPYKATPLAPTCRASPQYLRNTLQLRKRSRLKTMDTLPQFGSPKNKQGASVAAGADGAAGVPQRGVGAETVPKRVLLIEDEEIQRRLLTKQLQAMSYEVFEAKDGVEGLAALKERRYTLVLCDKLMPRMNGDVCVREFRKWEKERRPWPQPSQFICGLSATKEDELPEGFNLYASKPIRRSDLLKILRPGKTAMSK